MTLHKITELCTEWFSFCPNLTSEFRTIAMFKRSVKQSDYSNKSFRYVFDLLLHQSSLDNVEHFMSCLHKFQK
jgi:hypothetical protein